MRFSWIGPVVLATPLLWGCPTTQVDIPSGAFGRSSDPLPPGATEVDPAAFQAMQADGGVRLTSPQQDAIDSAVDATLSQEDLDTVNELATRRPDLNELLFGKPDPTDTTVRSSGDGNYLHDFTDQTGNPRTVVTMGSTAKLRRLAEGLRRFPSYDNQDRTYRDFYAHITAALNGDQLAQLQLNLQDPSSDTYPSLDASDLTELNKQISSRWESIIPFITLNPQLPAGYVNTCANEQGTGAGTDRSGDGTACATHKAQGVYQNFFWPQKYYATCVKDQKNRGTCGAFGIVGALEMAVAQKYSRWVNLSEQDLYAHVKLDWWPSNYGDGVGTQAVWQKMIEQSYLVPFEDEWPYNPSPSRTADDTTMVYTHSCDGYSFNGYCSDTNHQGKLICATLVFGIRYCGYVTPPAPGTGYRVSDENELWDPDNIEHSIGMTLLALIFQRPVVISLDVVPTFDHPDANGYVSYVNPDGKSRGGHILEVTGFVGNSDLHTLFPGGGVPDGSGGGYLIIKNSWGVCYADAGYVYLPLDWVRAHTWSMTVLAGDP